MRSAILCLLMCLAAFGPLSAQDPEPVIREGRGPGGWLGMQVHDKYLGLSIGYPWVQRGGRSLGLHVGFGAYSGSGDGADTTYPDGMKSKSGVNLGLYAGGKVFFGGGIERMQRTDAHKVFANYRTSSYETTLTKTSGYFLLGYRSWPGLGIYIQGSGAIGIGVGVSIQL